MLRFNIISMGIYKMRINYILFYLISLILSYPISETRAFDKTYENEKNISIQSALDQKLVEKALTFLKKGEYEKVLPILYDLEKRDNPWALNALGTLYKKGYLVPQNYKKSFLYYNRSINLNYALAFFNLAEMYELGLGTKVNFEKALLLYKKAANNNHIESQTKIGFIFANGQLGVSRNYKEAIKWLKIASINGDKIAQRNLGLFYENGYGVSRNYYEAKKWYVMSGQNGDQEARGAVKRINNLIKVNPEIYSKNKIDAESIDLFTDVRTITIKRKKELFQSYVAIRETQIDSNYLTEGKVVIDNEICSSHAVYNSYVNRGVFQVMCPSGYKASGLVTPLGTNRGSRGEGKDSFGNIVQFNFHDKLQGQAKKEDMIALFEKQKVIKISEMRKRGLANSNEVQKNLIKSHNFQALIIAINNYKYIENLKTPIRDGRAIGKILQKKYGFNVDYLENSTRDDILKKLHQLVKNLKKNDNLLIYFAGHGKMVADEGFWLPSDAEKDLDLNWVSNNEINRKLRQIKANNILVIADSCFSGALLKKGTDPDDKKIEASIESYLNTKSRVAITAGGLIPVLDGGGGGHSVFARIMINYLNNNSTPLTAQKLYASTVEDVTNLSMQMKHKQTPEIGNLLLHGHEGPDFVFLPR